MGMIETVLILVAVFWLGYQTSARFHQKIFQEILRGLGVTDRQLKDLLQRQQQQLTDQAPQESTADLTVVEVKLEQMGDVLYAYRKSDHQFLGQGTDLDTLVDRLNNNLTPCRVIIHKEDGADLLQKNNT
jgi:hypothetical protein